jgi:hypothetical protein
MHESVTAPAVDVAATLRVQDATVDEAAFSLTHVSVELAAAAAVDIAAAAQVEFPAEP